jgi:membrane-associated phospholipid phosphatase
MKNRFLFVGLIIFTACLYIPLNRSLSGGVILAIPLDRFVPLWPVWVIPYLLCLPAWALGLLWVSWKTDDRQFHTFVSAALFANLFAAMFYFFYPTYVDRPLLTGSGWAFKLLGMVYQNDRVYNAFPSGHVYMTTLFCLFLNRWYPRTRGLWAMLFVTVVSSTLFTHQHYLLDVLGGSFLGCASYYFGNVVSSSAKLSLLQLRPKGQAGDTEPYSVRDVNKKSVYENNKNFLA